MTALVLGAVAYDSKVVAIWEGFKAYFESRGLPFDYVLYSNYERQVEAHLCGELDVAWNSPLAWIETKRAAQGGVRAIAMRDTDRDLTSVILARPDVRRLEDLRGKTIAVGAADSPQATLIPLLALAEAGLEPGRDVEVVRHDVHVGKHGDHVGGERDAVRSVLGGIADAACVIDGNRLAFVREGLFAPSALSVLHQTPPYDHCNFTVIGPVTPEHERLVALLLEMSYEDPFVRPLLDMEGLKKWQPGRTTGYAQLARAVDRFHTIEAWLARVR
jgi:ABC-type phosphate/phosphonate transport system substrate-binding protein